MANESVINKATKADVEGKKRIRFHVQSTRIKEVTYKPPKQELLVVFNKGDSYNYSEVTIEEFVNFANADSKGKWFEKNIKGKKPFERKGD